MGTLCYIYLSVMSTSYKPNPSLHLQHFSKIPKLNLNNLVKLLSRSLIAISQPAAAKSKAKPAGRQAHGQRADGSKALSAKGKKK